MKLVLFVAVCMVLVTAPLVSAGATSEICPGGQVGYVCEQAEDLVNEVVLVVIRSCYFYLGDDCPINAAGVFV